MMEQGSDFNVGAFGEEMGERVPVGGSRKGRYRVFKTRIYGKLHFEKRVAEEYAADLLTVEALHKEFVIGYGLSHPGVVRYLMYKDGAVFEEYVDGVSLREMLDKDDPRLGNQEFLRRVCIELLGVLRYIHSQGVLHLDIKPENVMISNVGEGVKLVDFGCAKSAEFDSTSGFTFRYMAPEQADGEVNTYTDIFLLGRLMEELSAYAGLQRKWRKFISKATAENVRDRFADDAEALAAVPVKSRRRRGWIMIPVVLLCIVAGGLGYYLLQKTGDIDKGVVGVESESTEKPGVMTEDMDSVKSSVKSSESSAKPAPSINVGNGTGMTTAGLTTGLRREVEQHIRGRYNSRVFPAVDACDGRGELSAQEAYEKMNRESVAAQQDAVDFGEALGRKYPAEADYIMSIVSQEVAAQQMNVARRYDKAFERCYGMTQEEPRQEDRRKAEELLEELDQRRKSGN